VLPDKRPMTRSSQLIAYGATGLAAAVAHYGVLIALVSGAGWRPLIATLLGFVAGGVVSYGLNRRFTFESSRNHLDAGWRFGVIAAVGFVATGLLMVFFNEHLGWNYVLCQILITLIVMVLTFTGHKFWSFAEAR